MKRLVLGIVITVLIISSGVGLFSEDNSPIPGPAEGWLVSGTLVNKKTGQPVEGEVLAIPEGEGNTLGLPLAATDGLSFVFLKRIIN